MSAEGKNFIRAFQEFEEYYMDALMEMNSIKHSDDKESISASAGSIGSKIAAMSDPGTMIQMEFMKYGRENVIEAALEDDSNYDRETREEIIERFRRAEGFLFALDRNLEEIMSLHGIDEEGIETIQEEYEEAKKYFNPEQSFMIRDDYSH